MRKVLRITLVANPTPGGRCRPVKEDKFKRAQFLCYHMSQCSYSIPLFFQLSSISHNPHGKGDPASPWLTSTSPARSDMVNSWSSYQPETGKNTYNI